MDSMLPHLGSRPMVLFDLETAGARARMYRAGVDPAKPIPSGATAVYGITDNEASQSEVCKIVRDTSCKILPSNRNISI